jgi:hypothetical protein
MTRSHTAEKYGLSLWGTCREKNLENVNVGHRAEDNELGIIYKDTLCKVTVKMLKG